MRRITIPGRGSDPKTRSPRGRRLLGVALPLLFILMPSPGSGRPVLGQPVNPETKAILDPALRPLRRTDSSAHAFDAARAPFPLAVRGDPVAFHLYFLPVLPGEVIRLEADTRAQKLTLTYSAGHAAAGDEGGWSWTAPEEPGSYAIRLARDGSSEGIFLNVFVLHPQDRVRSGSLNGYRIGSYQNRPLRGDSIYLPPPGFIEVGSRDEDILVSPHFTIGQFLCKQAGDPRYLALSRYLVAKLEAILEATNAKGYSAPTLHIMSGFRTPWYNQAIGNGTVYSRHLWGGAADVFLDRDGDGMMDDLNGDGESTIADARILLEIAQRIDASAHLGSRPGGLAAYRRNAVRGPFIHVDARGRQARW